MNEGEENQTRILRGEERKDMAGEEQGRWKWRVEIH